MVGRSFEHLARLVAERAVEEGRSASALPGLWYFRFSAPAPPKPARTTRMYFGVALGGRKRFEVAGGTLTYDQRNYILVGGETDYRAAPVDPSPERPYLSIGIQLPPELVLRTLLELGADSAPAGPGGSSSAPAALLAPLDDGLVDALCRLVLAVDDPRGRRVLAPLTLREIVFRLLCTDAAAVLRQVAGAGADRERIREAMEHIESHAHERLSVGGLARRVAMSPSHFAHRFKAVASVSPMQFQKQVRLDRARELLLAGGLGAAEIAARVGYGSPSHFTRDFKRQFGLAPARYARAFDARASVPLGDDAAE